MKTLLLTHHWKPYTNHSPSSGYERLVWYIAKSLDVNVLSWKKWGDIIPEDEQEPFRVNRITTPATDMFLEKRLMISWRAMQMAHSYDVVHALYSIPALFPALRHPTVATVHILPEIKPGIWTKYHGFIQKRLLNRVAHIIAVSTNLEEILIDRYGTDRVTYIPHGVDIHVFKPGIVDPSETRNRLLGDRFQSMAVVVGAHGLDGKLIRNLAHEHKETLFVIINRYIASRISGERKGIPIDLPNVEFAFDVSEKKMIAIYECADLIFRPLQFATANNSILEAMAMAKPIVVHKLPGVIDYIDSSMGYLAENDEDFLSQFRQAMDHPDERLQKGRNARTRAEQEFAWEHVARKTIAIYSAVNS